MTRETVLFRSRVHGSVVSVTRGTVLEYHRESDSYVVEGHLGGAPQDVRAALGRLLATARGLPAAGAVGGFAALDERQLGALRALDADGPPAPPRA